MASACHSGAGPDDTLSDAGAGASDGASDAAGDAGSFVDAASVSDGMATDLVVVLATSTDPHDIAVDATYVYWTDSASTPYSPVGAVMRVPKQGGAATEIAAGQYGPSDLALDDTHVYWFEAGKARVVRARKDGTELEKLADGGGFAIALDPSSVYWANVNGVMTVPKTGGTPLVLVAGMTGDGTWGGLAVDDTHVYWTLAPSTMRVAKSGGAPEVFSSWKAAMDLAVDDTHVYGAGWKVRKSDGAAMNLCWPCEPFGPVALDDTSVYWADYGDAHQLVKVPKSGGPPEVLVDGMFFGQVGLAVDDAFLYWAGDDGASILMTPKE